MDGQHHHRSTTKSSHKPFKSRHASKSALKEQSKGKINAFDDRGARRTPHQQVMSKLTRRNQAKQKRIQKTSSHASASRVFSGRDGAPRQVAVVPLTDDVSPKLAVRSLNSALGVEENVPEEGWARVEVERFKQKLQYMVVGRNLWAALDAARVADFVVFVLSAEQEVDGLGELMLRGIEGQGVGNVMAVVQGLDAIEPPKRRPQVVSSLKSFITHFYPTLEKVHALDSSQECLNVTRSLCTTTPKGIRWREDRSWMMVEDIKWPSGKAPQTDAEATGEVVLTGVVRGKGLKADRLVEVGEWGTFQIEKITAAPLETKKKTKGEDMAVDQEGQEALLEQPTEDQDDLAELAPEEVAMEDADDYPVSVAPSERKGVLLDDHHYFSDDADAEMHRPKKLPRGTSKYQSAWYLDDVDYSGSDMESVASEDEEGDLDMDGPANPADGMEGIDQNGREPTEYAQSEYPQSEMFLDPAPEDEAEQIAAYQAERKKEAEEDLEFPDEIELHPNVQARERLAKYRGLKSLRTSHWETDEDRPYEPECWRRLLEISDYKGAKARMLREALVGGVQPGTRVHVHLRNVPLSLQNKHNPARTLCLFSLLRHEHKHTVLNYAITLSSDYEEPMRSKEELILQCGPRRLRINPLYSQAGNTPNDVHKFDRYLHPGRSAVATFIGPLTWGSVPALFFKRKSAGEDEGEKDGDDFAMNAEQSSESSLQLVGTGTTLAPSTARVVAKRVVLTGHPYKIHKRVVTVRYMFFNAEDVAWFKALQLWTKRGRSGYMKESLGTHGYFKATFDGRINPQDAVGVSLYKRVWPREAKAVKAGEEP
ncbi:hypothetical protein IWX90DRAFT_512573 [Phyllosticta citrichinensis]|uniref:Bms1-type G domain-containing protein n=1 Tax=Phyllosticta citrichinensis TaxID=1130410 RepID=A0ABR1Y0S6_9PEZI